MNDLNAPMSTEGAMAASADVFRQAPTESPHGFVLVRLCEITLKVFQANAELEEAELRRLTSQIASSLREIADDIESYGKSLPKERAETEKSMSLEMVRTSHGKHIIRSKASREFIGTDGHDV
jgi:hypothetical protein